MCVICLTEKSKEKDLKRPYSWLENSGDKLTNLGIEVIMFFSISFNNSLLLLLIPNQAGMHVHCQSISHRISEEENKIVRKRPRKTRE
jgi:hypothetical protein